MSDHNFEKQIQQKLDELKVPPAPSVWTSIEAQIRKDKRRRRGVIFFPVFLLLLAAGAYFTIVQPNSTQNTSASNNTLTNSTQENSSTPPNAPGNTITEETKTASKANQLTKDQVAEKTAGKPARQPATQPTSHQVPEARSKEKIGKESSVASSPSVKLPSSESNQDFAKHRQANPKSQAGTKNKKLIAVTGSVNRSGQDVSNTVADKKEKSNSAVSSTEANNKNADDVVSGNRSQPEAMGDSQTLKPSIDPLTTSVTDSSAIAGMNKSMDSLSVTPTIADNKTKEKNINRSKFQWGVIASGGISNMSDGGFFEGIIGSEKALVADVAPSGLNNSPPNTGPSAVTYKSSPIEKGFAFSAGVFVQKNLAKKFSISTGLQYRYYSTHIQVGSRIDSSAMVQNAFGSSNVYQFYRAAPIPTTQQYTNQFHFIELPVIGNFQLNKSNRVPIFLNGGLSLSALVSTNALHFDSQTGVYYKDNDLFRTLQANFSAGVAVSLWNKSKMPVHLGPQIHYGLTNLLKPEFSPSKHLFYFGLNAKVFMKK